MSRAITQLIIEGKNNSKKAFDEVNGQINLIDKSLSRAGKSLAAAFSVSVLTSAIRGIANAADSYNLMNARLKLATDSQQEFNTAQVELRRIADATQTPLASLVTLYGRISRPLKEAGRSQADILKVTEAVATSFRISGASAQEAENGVIQFAQALGSGALRGDEFNSVAEQAPRLMQALAAALGVPIGALKEMASQGLLTASVVTDALTGQLEVLRKEAASLPQTVGGAMTALADDWNEAIGQADVQPLIDAINELGKTITDPQTRDSLVLLASALTMVAGAAIEAGAGTVSLAQDLGYIAARITGNVTEVDRAAKELAKFEAAAQGFGMLDLYMTDEQIAKGLADWRAYYAALTEEQNGLNEEMKFLSEVAAAVADQARQNEIDARTKYIGELKTLQESQIKAAEKGAKALVAAEKKANSELAKVRDERKKIEARYKEAQAGLGGEGDASYGAAQALKVRAREALAARDVEGAQAQAQAALKMLQELAAAGGNTYGFGGFISELEAIELAANDIEQSNAQAKIEEIKVSMANLKAEADKLKDLPVSVKTDEVTIENVRTSIQALINELGQKEIVLPVRVAHPDGPIVPALPDFPGYATGTNSAPPGMAWVGERGPELINFAGGEQVLTATASKNLMARMAGLNIPDLSAGLGETAANAEPALPNLGRLSMDFGGGDQFNVYATQGEALNLQRLVMKRGRTKLR